MTLVAGVDSSTQSCKVVVRDADTGALVREGRAPHPDGTEVDPAAWWAALQAAIDEAGGLDDVAAVAVGGQQHGMVLPRRRRARSSARRCCGTTPARPQAAADLIAELGGRAGVGRRRRAGAGRVVHGHQAALAGRARAGERGPDGGGLPAARLAHLAAAPARPASTRWSPTAATQRHRLLVADHGRLPDRPARAGVRAARPCCPGCSARPSRPDARGRRRCRARRRAPATTPPPRSGSTPQPGDVVVSIGTSGVVSTRLDRRPARDPTGTVAGFADATGNFLPLVVHPQRGPGARRHRPAARRRPRRASRPGAGRARRAPAGSCWCPTWRASARPNRPDATGALHGLTLATTDPAHLARAAVEGLLCGLADGLDALARAGRPVAPGAPGRRRRPVRRRSAGSPPPSSGVPVLVPPPGEYVADGAARQAAWVLAGGDSPPAWPAPARETYEADPVPHVRERYAESAS